jgi:hypothetical protein
MALPPTTRKNIADWSEASHKRGRYRLTNRDRLHEVIRTMLLHRWGALALRHPNARMPPQAPCRGGKWQSMQKHYCGALSRSGGSCAWPEKDVLEDFILMFKREHEAYELLRMLDDGDSTD